MEKESLNFIERDIIESIARGQKIVTRFPPEPNGYPHIGHIKASLTNYTLAQKYGGYMNLRMDDTNPEKEDMHYVETFVDNLAWLGIEWKDLLFASDYYEQLYDMAVGLVKKGLAYVDFQSADEMSKNRGSFTEPGKNSPYRDTSAKENLELFKQMRDGKFADGHCVLRAKIDMTHPTMTMRDPAIYRIMRAEHYRTGNTWCIYPMYDFAHCLSDAIESISHSCCSLEFANNQELYNWFVDNAWTGKCKPRQFEFGRMNIEQTVMSKRYLKRFVDEGIVDGWDDPRMPTISGMRRRGYTPEAIKDFVISTGISRTNTTVPMSALEFYVRGHLDKIADRVGVVFNPIKVLITNYKGKFEKLPVVNNPNDENSKSHKQFFSKDIYIDGEDFAVNPPPKWKRLTVGGTVRLRGAYIISCENVIYKKDGSIDYLECSYFENSRSGSDTSGIKPNGTIHYVEASTATSIVVNEYLPLLKEGTSLDEDNFNLNSKFEHNALAEPYIRECKNTVQFVRKGYYVLDKKLSVRDNLVFIKTVGLKEGF
ncbi:MAG: glutamine--tRNA ligase [Firmicutes bacterium]|nr:glutamine--tRNA ligase [Bacillota bacterium]